MFTSSNILLKLVSIALGKENDYSLPSGINWRKIIRLSCYQGVAAIAFDGLQCLIDENEKYTHNFDLLDSPELEELKFEWLGAAMNCEQESAKQYSAIESLQKIWEPNALEIIALKGVAFAQYYPIPEHRYSCDFDCFLRYADKRFAGDFMAWELADKLVARSGIKVDDTESKHSRYLINGVSVENHRNLIGINGSKRLKVFDAYLQGLLNNQELQTVSGTQVLSPSWLFNALFCITHARIHFLEEDGITLKHVLDWVVLRKCQEKSDTVWAQFELDINRFGLRKFYLAFDEVADYVMGENSALSKPAQLLFDDILAPRDIRHFDSKFKSRLNILRMVWINRWKYRYFSDTSAVATMWRYVYGHFFDRH